MVTCSDYIFLIRSYLHRNVTERQFLAKPERRKDKDHQHAFFSFSFFFFVFSWSFWTRIKMIQTTTVALLIIPSLRHRAENLAP